VIPRNFLLKLSIGWKLRVGPSHETLAIVAPLIVISIRNVTSRTTFNYTIDFPLQSCYTILTHSLTTKITLKYFMF
jgi:hypothetical protein